MNRTFKSDKFRKARGGYSRWLDIFCENCGEKILLYQKDGSGTLKRLYLDRIFAPKRFVDLDKFSLRKIPDLKCTKCKAVLAIPVVYQKENRKAYRLFVGAVKQNIVKNN